MTLEPKILGGVTNSIQCGCLLYIYVSIKQEYIGEDMFIFGQLLTLFSVKLIVRGKERIRREKEGRRKEGGEKEVMLKSFQASYKIHHSPFLFLSLSFLTPFFSLFHFPLFFLLPSPIEFSPPYKGKVNNFFSLCTQYFGQIYIVCKTCA